jgi:3',5'-cyclic AMP phosphodiesterase CpdA
MRPRPCPPSCFAAVLLLFSMLGVAAPALAAPATDGFEPFSFALLGDPQIGYGPGGELADAKRFQAVVDDLNFRKLPFALIPGDLVQDRTFWQRFAFDRVFGDLATRALLIPGNHDVVDTATLERYRAAHGKDYYDFVHENCAFVMLNSETARDPEISQTEFDAQWRFIETTLAKHHAAARRHIVLVAHRPPFVHDEQEEDTTRNWPLDTRTRLLTLARQHGVRWFLAGHLHVTLTTLKPDGLSIAVAAGTSRNFDDSPIGYRLFRVEADRLSDRFVEVLPPVRQPFTVPGFAEWTPRLFDFSLRHWILTLLYAGAGALAYRAARGSQSKAGAARDTWFGIAALCFFLGANMQLDLDELLREVGRLAAKLTGIHPIRHVITGTGLVVGLGAATWWLIRRLRTFESRLTILALAMCGIPTTWFVLSAISHHDIGMLFDETWWDLLVLAALGTIAACARKVHGRPAARRPLTSR